MSEDEALTRRAAREARRAIRAARSDGDGDGEAPAGAVQAAREAATAAAVGAAVGAVKALAARQRQEEEPGPDPPPEPEDMQEEPEPEPEPEATTRAEEKAPPPEQREGIDPSDVDRAVRAAREQLRRLHGADAESVSSFGPTRDGWRVTLEVLELHRVPETTDVLASYLVELDRDGNLRAYERLRRYQRSEAHGS